MAINVDPTTLGCDGQDDGEPVAFGRWQAVESPWTSTFGPWELLCYRCVRKHDGDPDYQLVDFDPARQRRPDPDHHDGGTWPDDNRYPDPNPVVRP